MDAEQHAWVSRLRGRFIAFEGADGCGKSTQLKRLEALCERAGVAVTLVREPGGTPIGERIRDILLAKTSEGMTLRCEMLLYMASRSQLVEAVIRPALARGDLVIADRFLASTYAYQGAGGGLPEAEIDAAASIAVGVTRPEVNLIYDIDPQTAARRAGILTTVGKGGRKGEAGVSLFADRMESKGDAFHRKVREGYLALAKRDPARHLVIDASGDPEAVWMLTLAGLKEWLKA
ncbi:MAG: hypothetical protein HBSAPP03_13400 [Phycisphaerae bacterium]|nr:MAG: hypothetical protein HBSAPP03_13400 [Phycisphaerae bacterium]